jgi:hypothetical protein
MAVDLSKLIELIDAHNDLQLAQARLRALAKRDPDPYVHAAYTKARAALDAVDRMIEDERVAQGV